MRSMMWRAMPHGRYCPPRLQMPITSPLILLHSSSSFSFYPVSSTSSTFPCSSST